MNLLLFAVYQYSVKKQLNNKLQIKILIEVSTDLIPFFI